MLGRVAIVVGLLAAAITAVAPAAAEPRGANQLQLAPSPASLRFGATPSMRWVGATTKAAVVTKVRRYGKKAKERLEDLIAERREASLDIPFGPKAANREHASPPSTRPVKKKEPGS